MNNVDFTREPIIETIITPKEGCKLVVRSSKSVGQEEYFVDALEVVSFGHCLFYRSVERPKAFLVPTADYEVLEVRETRMVLKNVGLDRSIKIGGGREPNVRQPKEIVEKHEPAVVSEEVIQETADVIPIPDAVEGGRVDKKRDRRRHYRRRRGRDDTSPAEGTEGSDDSDNKSASKIDLPEPKKSSNSPEATTHEPATVTPTMMSSLLPPPPQLISETIKLYKDNALFQGAFYNKHEVVEELAKDEEDNSTVHIVIPAPESFDDGQVELSEEFQTNSDSEKALKDSESIPAEPFEDFEHDTKEFIEEISEETMESENKNH